MCPRQSVVHFASEPIGLCPAQPIGSLLRCQCFWCLLTPVAIFNFTFACWRNPLLFSVCLFVFVCVVGLVPLWLVLLLLPAFRVTSHRTFHFAFSIHSQVSRPMGATSRALGSAVRCPFLVFVCVGWLAFSWSVLFCRLSKLRLTTLRFTSPFQQSSLFSRPMAIASRRAGDKKKPPIGPWS